MKKYFAWKNKNFWFIPGAYKVDYFVQKYKCTKMKTKVKIYLTKCKYKRMTGILIIWYSGTWNNNTVEEELEPAYYMLERRDQQEGPSLSILQLIVSRLKRSSIIPWYLDYVYICTLLENNSLYILSKFLYLLVLFCTSISLYYGIQTYII